MKIAITGANSSVGLKLLEHIVATTEDQVIAGVRAVAATKTLPQSPQIEPRIISYADVDGLASAFNGADCVVHLAGILVENRHTNYRAANVETTAATVAAARQCGADHFIFISVIGADQQSRNAYFKSKGLAEALVSESGLAATIIRTPILLGAETTGAEAIVAVAAKPKARLLGGGNYTMRPLDIHDLSRAILQCSERGSSGTRIYELAGPESIPYRKLIEQTAAIMGTQVQLSSFPIWLAKLGAALVSRLQGGGITPTVIDVITTDEVVAANADSDLGVTLTPLATTLQQIVQHRQAK